MSLEPLTELTLATPGQHPSTCTWGSEWPEETPVLHRGSSEGSPCGWAVCTLKLGSALWVREPPHAPGGYPAERRVTSLPVSLSSISHSLFIRPYLPACSSPSSGVVSQVQVCCSR